MVAGGLFRERLSLSAFGCGCTVLCRRGAVTAVDSRTLVLRSSGGLSAAAHGCGVAGAAESDAAGDSSDGERSRRRKKSGPSPASGG